MNLIKPIGINKSNINEYKIIKGQLIYCIDTLEATYDISNTNRILLDTTRQLDTELERKTLEEPKINIIYIVKETNNLYRYKNEWVIIDNEEDISDLLYNAKHLVPTTLQKKGIQIAPKTLANQVFLNDGSTVEDTMKEFIADGKKITLQSKTVHIIATHDGQSIFSIPYPVPDYDITKFPIVVLLEDKILKLNEYKISSEQLLIDGNIEIKKGDRITLIFNYCNMITNEDLNAVSINNVRIFFGALEPVDKQVTDVWFDSFKKEVKQWDGTIWNIIVKNNDSIVKYIKNTTIIANSTDHVQIGIEGFNADRDMLMVFENSTFLDEETDYTIVNNKYIKSKVGDIWEISSEEKTYFTFLVFKNVSPYTGEGELDTRLSNMEKRINELNAKLN